MVWKHQFFGTQLCFVRTLYYDASILDDPAWHGLLLNWVTQALSPQQDCDPWKKYIYRILIQSSIDRYLSCFLALAIAYSATMNPRVHICFLIYVYFFFFFKYIFSGVELLEDRVVLVFDFLKETPYCFSMLAAPVYIPTKSVRGVPILCILSNFYYL